MIDDLNKISRIGCKVIEHETLQYQLSNSQYSKNRNELTEMPDTSPGMSPQILNTLGGQGPKSPNVRAISAIGKEVQRVMSCNFRFFCVILISIFYYIEQFYKLLFKRFRMSKPAARITDMHVCPMQTPGTPPIPHVGGPITGPGMPTVLIGNMPAAVMGDICVCVGPPDTIILGSTTVLIGNKPAARMGDSTAHGGKIVAGLPTVLIGG